MCAPPSFLNTVLIAAMTTGIERAPPRWDLEISFSQIKSLPRPYVAKLLFEHCGITLWYKVSQPLPSFFPTPSTSLYCYFKNMYDTWTCRLFSFFLPKNVPSQAMACPASDRTKADRRLRHDPSPPKIPDLKKVPKSPHVRVLKLMLWQFPCG
jgi:hypothetical protein